MYNPWLPNMRFQPTPLRGAAEAHVGRHSRWLMEKANNETQSSFRFACYACFLCLRPHAYNTTSGCDANSSCRCLHSSAKNELI